MYRKLLLAYDGTEGAQPVLRQGAAMAKLCGAEVVLLAVVDLPAGLILAEAVANSGLPEAEQAQAESVLHEGVAALRGLGVDARGRLAAGEPEQEIVAAAIAEDADLIVIGHRKQGGWSALRFGSVGKRLLSEAPCSVLVALDAAGSIS
jgi:nucleotide-binding universal stress UspA family protein